MLISCVLNAVVLIRLTKKAEPPPTCDVNRDSGTESANGGWLRRLVRRHSLHILKSTFPNPVTVGLLLDSEVVRLYPSILELNYVGHKYPCVQSFVVWLAKTDNL